MGAIYCHQSFGFTVSHKTAYCSVLEGSHDYNNNNSLFVKRSIKACSLPNVMTQYYFLQFIFKNQNKATKLNIFVYVFNISCDEKKTQKMEEIVFINVMVNFVREPTQLRG